jgi:hypothetical protein
MISHAVVYWYGWTSCISRASGVSRVFCISGASRGHVTSRVRGGR